MDEWYGMETGFARPFAWILNGFHWGDISLLSLWASMSKYEP